MRKLFTYLGALLPSRNDYRFARQHWRGDLFAGITVGIVALPLALAFGVSSGVGAEVGLITAVIAGIVAAIFGGSNVQISGPTGAMVVVLGPIVVQYGVTTVALLSIMAGVIVLIGGVLKLGRVVGYVPWPVIEGFTLGIAVIIFLQQVPAAIGTSPGPSENALLAAIESFTLAEWAHPERVLWPIGIVIVVACIMVFAPRLHPQLPGSIIAIILVATTVYLARIPMETIGALPSALPAPQLPLVNLDLLIALAGPACTVAALAAIESLLSARVAAGLADTGPYDADRELVGQGLASIAVGFFGGMPATGAIARTAVNIRAGGRTRIASIVHSLVLLAVVYLASTVVSEIPLAALSGVLMVTAFRMVSVATVRTLVGSTRSDTFIFFLTAVITVSFDLIIAVGIGIAVAAFFALRKLSAASGVAREELPGAAQLGDERIALFRLDGSLFFGAADRILEQVLENTSVSVVIIRMSQIQIMDATGGNVVTEMIRGLNRRGITVLVKGIQEQHLRLLTRVGVVRKLQDEHHLFDNLDEAVAHARALIRAEREEQGDEQLDIGI